LRPLAIALLLCSSAHASEPELFGMGARSPGLAGLGAADAEGYDATYINPAGLVGPTRRRLSVGYVLARYSLSLDGMPRNVDSTNGIVIGADLPLPFGGVMKDRLALGMGFYFPVGVINRARDGFPDEPRLALLDDRTQVVSVLVAAGAKVHERFSIGIGVLALAALIGEIQIRAGATGAFTTVSEEQLVASYSPVVGMRAIATRWLKLGLTFRGESKSRYDIAVKPDLGNALPLILPTMHIAGTAQYDPMQMQLEAAFLATGWLKVLVGLTWKHWSAYQNPVENATTGTPPQPAPGYHDTVVPRVAAEGHRDVARGRVRLTGRLGYYFEWSPAPQGPDRALLDADRHVLTFGAGLELLRGAFTFALDLFGQWHHLDGNPRAGGDFGTFGFTVGVDL
jgi:long-chain fatty acid transport protein